MSNETILKAAQLLQAFFFGDKQEKDSDKVSIDHKTCKDYLGEVEEKERTWLACCAGVAEGAALAASPR